MQTKRYYVGSAICVCCTSTHESRENFAVSNTYHLWKQFGQTAFTGLRCHCACRSGLRCCIITRGCNIWSLKLKQLADIPMIFDHNTHFLLLLGRAGTYAQRTHDLLSLPGIPWNHFLSEGREPAPAAWLDHIIPFHLLLS